MSRRATPAESASRWHVDLRTAQRWHAGRGKHHPPPAALAAGEPGARAMLAWFASLPGAIQSKLSRPFRAEITRLRIAIERGLPLAPGAAPDGASAPAANKSPRRDTPDDPDWTDFLAARAAAPSDADTTLSSLKLRFDFASHKIGLAQRRGDHAGVREWTDTAARLAGVIHDEELRAQRLGRELGDTLPRPEAERLARALAYWLARSTDALLAHLTPLLATLTATTTAPLTREELRAHLEPPALATRLLDPFVRAAQINAGHTLPPWLIAAMREALAATLEDGAKLFDTLYAMPVPRPTIPTPIPIHQVTTGPTSDGPRALATPSDHGPDEPKPAGEATASHSPAGSVPPQTA